MEITSEHLTAIVGAAGVGGATVTTFISKLIFGRIDDMKADIVELKKQVDKAFGKLEECQEEHATSREKVASLEATISVLTKHSTQDIQSEARTASREASDKANGHGH